MLSYYISGIIDMTPDLLRLHCIDLNFHFNFSRASRWRKLRWQVEDVISSTFVVCIRHCELY